MIKSTICAGTAALLSMSFIMPAAQAEAPLWAADYLSVDSAKTRLATNPVPGAMKDAPFADRLEAAQKHPNVYAGEVWLTQLLGEPALSAEQQARVLYARAQHRWKKSSNKLGAFEDFTEFTKRFPDDRYARNAGIEAGYVRTEIDRVEIRMDELQTLSAWFEDAWVLGMRDEAATRYKRSGFLPEPSELARLQEAGYVCGSSAAGAKQVSSDAPNLYWCG